MILWGKNYRHLPYVWKVFCVLNTILYFELFVDDFENNVVLFWKQFLFLKSLITGQDPFKFSAYPKFFFFFFLKKDE
jgi:hypothetical protein